MPGQNVLIVSPSPGFAQHAKLALGPACRVDVASGIDDVSSNGRGPFQLAIVHEAAIESGLNEDAFKRLREHADAVAVAADVPSMQELLELSRYRIQGYCNSYMADVHYRQMASMLADGMTWFHPPILHQALEVARGRHENRRCEIDAVLSELTRREREIAGDVAEGLSNREIAEHRGIAERTVKAHLTRIFKKLGARNRQALAVRLRGS